MVIEKVCAFITREGLKGKELLVFEHQDDPTAGIQVPAGTVEIDELLEQAVLREVQEEAGLTEVRIVKYLGNLAIDLPTGHYALSQSTNILSEPTSDASSVELPGGYGTVINRAWYVEQLEIYEDWSKVTFDFLKKPTTGWIKSNLLVNQLLRHFYHLVPFQDTQDRWSIFAENLYTFNLYWFPLTPRSQIALTQVSWLDEVYKQLL